MVFGADGHARTFRCFASTPLFHGVLDLPFVGSDFLFLPLPLLVIPFMTSADFHSGITLALKLLNLIIGRSNVRLLLCSILLFHGIDLRRPSRRLPPAGLEDLGLTPKTNAQDLQ